MFYFAFYHCKLTCSCSGFFCERNFQQIRIHHSRKAARLAYSLKLGGHFVDLETTEDLSYLGGWLGDAVLPDNNGTTFFKNDDYCADLDAENIYRLIEAGRSSVDAVNFYYGSLTSESNRADKFLQYISYDFVKQKVFYELIDREYEYYISEVSKNNNVATVICNSDIAFYLSCMYYIFA